MSQIKISSISNLNESNGPVITGITTFTSSGSLKLPSGSNKERVGIESGSLRYNTTAKLFEFYDGTVWKYILPDNQANPIGVFAGGYSEYYLYNLQNMDYIQLNSLGDSQYYGTFYEDEKYNCALGGCSSTTRGVFGGGVHPSTSPIFYTTFSSKSEVQYFGSFPTNTTTGVQRYLMSCSNTTRGIYAGGYNPYLANINYITIASTGNALDFDSDLTVPAVGNPVSGKGRGNGAGVSDSTRGVFASGWGYITNTPADTWSASNIIDYVTIATTGTIADFGDAINTGGWGTAGSSSSTRGLYHSGFVPYATTVNNYQVTKRIEYITIQSTGNGTSFGDLTVAMTDGGGTSSSTRSIFCGGYTYVDVVTNLIEYVTISSTGNSLLFGYLSRPRMQSGDCSNNHGGLL